MMSRMKLTRRGLLLFIVFWTFVIVVRPVAATENTLVVCAPGFPGSTAEAQPAMDGLAAALAGAAGWKAGELGAVYFEDEAAGTEGMGQEGAALALVTLPFFLVHRDELALQPLAQAVPAEGTTNELWTLVAGAGRVRGPEDLAGWEIVSLAGHAPSFVRGVVFDGWGACPEGLGIVFSNRVLTALRRAAKGEDVAVLLDGQQAEALDRLPFADDLEVVRATEPMPTSLLCSVGDRLPPERVQGFVDAALGLADDDALAEVRLDGFVPLDTAALGRATAVFDRSGE